MGSLQELGHAVWESPDAAALPEAIDALFSWGGQVHQEIPTFCVENAWIPRWEYQIGLGGINAHHHAAPWSGCLDHSRWAGSIDRLREQPSPKAYAYADPTDRTAARFPEGEFIVIALQVGTDVNMADAPRRLRAPQKLIDAVSASNPPWRIVAKQHPARSVRESHASLKMRRPWDRLWLHEEGGIHGLLRQPGCRAVVALNSNALHDGLLWDVPGVALGRGTWPTDGSIFLRRLPRNWPQAIARHRKRCFDSGAATAYLGWLAWLQWTPERASVLGHVERLLDLLKGAP